MYNRILHATDLSENHFHMCQQAVDLAKRFEAQLYLLHAIETPTSLQIAQGLGFAEIDNPSQLKEDAQAVLAVLGESFKIPADHLFVEVGSIKQHVFTSLKNLDCNLLIIGRHMHHYIPAYLESSAHAINQEANCDVLTLNWNNLIK
ncbi:MAG: universal stress protein [Legionellaceae bacterium]|nr:universal stress protein [Legionellaceae bacterium]